MLILWVWPNTCGKSMWSTTLWRELCDRPETVLLYMKPTIREGVNCTEYRFLSDVEQSISWRMSVWAAPSPAVLQCSCRQIATAYCSEHCTVHVDTTTPPWNPVCTTIPFSNLCLDQAEIEVAIWIQKLIFNVAMPRHNEDLGQHISVKNNCQ